MTAPSTMAAKSSDPSIISFPRNSLNWSVVKA
jgi:hypothetical protein